MVSGANHEWERSFAPLRMTCSFVLILYPLMPDPTPTPPPSGQQPPPAAGFQISEETKKKFGDLIELIKKSESMNEEERQYWVNILPIMTPEQIQNLRDILENERKQLAAIDSKYQTEVDTLGQAEVIRQTEEARRTKRLERTGKETAYKQQEDKATENILRQIENDGSVKKD